jgi:hypothetical protein
MHSRPDMRINCEWQVPKEYSNEAPLGGGLGGFSAFKSLFQAPTTTVFVKENSEVLQVGHLLHLMRY